MSALDRKLRRDVCRLWVQITAISLVMACGVATIILALGAYRSLSETRSAFYDRYRFATAFAGLNRAPLSLREPILQIPGVRSVELRIVKPFIIDIEGMSEPGTGIAVSIPDTQPAVNRLYLRSGRWPDSGRAGEVAVLESFALAHGLQPGDRFSVLLNGKRQTLTLTAIVLSPEYVYAIGPGDMVPDPRRFAVIFMPRSAMAAVHDMEGAFNDIALRLQPGVLLNDVSMALDAILKPYGGTGTIDRSQQTSHAFLDNELMQLRAMAAVVPPIFLLLSAFLVNMVLTRLIALEREQIGLMKAVGYGSIAIGWHFTKLTLVIAVLGILIGFLFGNVLGRGMTRLYASFYSFPFLVFSDSMDLYAVAGAFSVSAALAGSVRAIVGVLRLTPAVAMLPPQPVGYRSFLGRGVTRHISQLNLMAIRHLLRWPLRAAMTAFGTSLAVGLLITALFTYDSVAFMIDTVFFRTERQDATVMLSEAAGPGALSSLRRLPGVMRAEPYRSTLVVLRRDHRARRLSITSIAVNADLFRPLDKKMNVTIIPPVGLLISERVAALLELKSGDMVEVELLDFGGRRVSVSVSAVIESYVGLAVFMSPEALDRLIGDGPRISGARLALDVAQLPQFYHAVKATPGIGAIALQRVSHAHFRETIENNIFIMTSVYVALAVIITFGVVYNTARIHLSERARELASLRVLGFSRSEASGVLLTEIIVLIAIAQPVGWLLGTGFAWSVVRGFESDLFRIPFVIERATYAKSSLIVVTVAAISALIVRRRVDRLDLVRVLKTRE
ncbi:ABC transporter permease [Pararhizobium haloflavum]|uniref:ABC transporter permease n=1 Tax=Pararhizobium haloflavum TaxID=2037914 RepID=UPI000C17CDA2|nr:ABC transporter permease [Pararhizobium haloflavum]